MVAIVDYGLGNVRSVAGAVEKLGYQALIASDSTELERAEKLILPGVGAFGDGMRNLNRLGLVATLNRLVHDRGVPILGICLGAELMARDSDEFGRHEGLGWIDAAVRRLRPGDDRLRMPHVGWNEVHHTSEHALFNGIPQGALFYFVHSYEIRCDDASTVVARCEYGGPVTAAVARGRVYGTQFHPEKSQRHGLDLLRNFLSLH
jgi:imidazole glycerol-phosphate synthase subunit HisH